MFLLFLTLKIQESWKTYIFKNENDFFPLKDYYLG